MKHRLLIITLIATTLLAGCGLFSNKKQKTDDQPVAAKVRTATGSNAADNEFSVGVSSVTVEKLAQKNQCVSTKGAKQISAKGPVEMYSVNCEDGRVFMAKCELRQCQPVATK